MVVEMIKQIFELPRNRLEEVEKSLWVDARKYVLSGRYHPSHGVLPVSSSSSQIMRDCLDLVVIDLNGFRVGYKEQYEDYEVSDDMDEHIAHCVLQGPVYFQIYSRDPPHFTKQIGIRAVGQKTEVTKIQDTIEEMIKRHNFEKVDSFLGQLGEDICRLNEAYGKQVIW